MPPSTIQPFDTSRVFTAWPSGEKATELTEPGWPLSVCSKALVAVSQSCTVPSSKPDMTCLPSSEKVTELTELEWPLSACSEVPVAASQSCTVLSREWKSVKSNAQDNGIEAQQEAKE